MAPREGALPMALGTKISMGAADELNAKSACFSTAYDTKNIKN